MVTLFTLFVGLFFFIDSWTDNLSKDIVTWITFMILIITSIISILFILWDWRTRYIKNKIKINLKKKKMKKMKEYEDVALRVLKDLHEMMPVDTNKMPWDNYQFTVYNSDGINDILTDEKNQNMNDILFDLFSAKRIIKKNKK
jgi:hypothetical protein